MACPACDTIETPILLGELGSRAHVRCRDCGWIWSMSAQALEDQADDMPYLARDYTDPAYARGSGFVLDQRAIQAAADFLGLRHQVHVQVRRGVRSYYGIYRGLLRRPSGARRATPDWPTPRHVIGLDAGMDPEQASRTLWHEMAHALQCERDYGGAWQVMFRDYNRAMRAVRAKSMRVRSGSGYSRYKAVHFEREADEYGCLAETDPLVRAA